MAEHVVVPTVTTRQMKEVDRLMAETFGIIGVPLVDARANFLKPAKFGDLVEIASRVKRRVRTASGMGGALR